MGGIVIKYSSAKSRPLPLHLPLDLLSTTFSSIQQHPPDPTPNDTVKNKFFKENAKILSSKTLSNIHPELRRLRLVLGCDYGRPKMILFLTRTTPITALLDSDDHFSQSLTDHSFVYDHFISHFDLPTDHHHHHPEIDHHATAPPTPLYLELYLPEIIALAAIANYQTFLTSSEHSDWVKYQLMADDPRNGSNSSYVSESLRSIAKLSSHRLVMGINQSDTAKLLSKTHWIVVLAHLLEEIPFAVSILGRDKEVNPSTTNKPLSTRSNHFHSPLFLASVRETSTPPPESMSILFGNSAFVDMVGSTREEIAQHPFDKYHHPHSSSSSSSSTPPPLDPELAQAIHDGTSIRIGTMYHPQSPLAPFLNLQSYLPIYDPEGHCNYFLVLHCDIWKHHQNPEYLQKLDILTDLLSKTVIPHRTHEDIFLKAYFYKSDDHDHGMKRQPSSYQPPHTSAKYCRHEDKSATVEAFQSESGPVDPLHYLNQLNHEE